MTTIIVGHQSVDVDCTVGMYLLACMLTHEGVDPKSIEFEFIPRGTTFKGIKVNPKNRSEAFGKDRIYHVDCGGGLFDDHKRRKVARSSTFLVASAYQVNKFFPQWGKIVHWVGLADTGELKGKMNLQHMVTGWKRQGKTDKEILKLVVPCIEAMLANGKAQVKANSIPIKHLSSIKNLPKTHETTLIKTYIDGFGRVGLISTTDQSIMGILRGKLKECKVIIGFDDKNKHVAIWGSKYDGADLRTLGVVEAIRKAEATSRGMEIDNSKINRKGNFPGMSWFAFEPNDSGQVIALLNGSLKVTLTENQFTVLSKQEIVDTVVQQITIDSVTEEIAG